MGLVRKVIELLRINHTVENQQCVLNIKQSEALQQNTIIKEIIKFFRREPYPGEYQYTNVRQEWFGYDNGKSGDTVFYVDVYYQPIDNKVVEDEPTEYSSSDWPKQTLCLPSAT